MKKQLIALAVGAALAAPAMAQVTLYGAIGASYTQSKTGAAAWEPQTQGQGQDHWKTTRLGARGEEDLGGGLKAGFVLEGDLSGAGGALGNADNIFNRLSFVSLSGGFGTLSFGRQNDAVKDIEGLGNGINVSDNLFNTTTVGDRIANAYKYVSPAFVGFRATVAYSENRTQDNGAGGNVSQNTDHISGAIAGKVGITDVAIAYGKEMTAAGVERKTTRVGAQLPLNANFTLGANYTKNSIDDDRMNQLMVQLKYVAGPYEIYGTYGKNDASADNINIAARSSGTVMSIAAGYNLSKRTALYAGYSNFSADGNNARDEKVATGGVFHSF